MFECTQRKYKKAVVNGAKVAQRTVSIDLVTQEGKTYKGYSSQDTSISLNWGRTRSCFESNVKPQHIEGYTQKRGIYHCSEPNALVTALNSVHNEINTAQIESDVIAIPDDWIEGVKFQNIRGDSSTPTPSAPCAVCAQWVAPRWESIYHLTDVITTETAEKKAAKLEKLPQEQEQRRIEQLQQEREQAERERRALLLQQRKDKKKRKQKESKKKQKEFDQQMKRKPQ